MIFKEDVKQRTKNFWLFSRPHLPSILTLIALSTSLSSFVCILEGKIRSSIICIWMGGIFDALDGRLARYIKACSNFGAEIDSLADLVSFGVSPILIIFFTQFNDTNNQKRTAWGSCIMYVCCMVIRLARFNVTHFPKQTSPKWSKQFFKGIPAPAGATLLMAPTYFSFTKIYKPCHPRLYITWIFFCSFLLICNIRTFSGKGKLIRGRKAPPKCIIISFVIILILIMRAYVSIWYISIFLTLAYLLSFPFSHITYKNYCRNFNDLEEIIPNL